MKKFLSTIPQDIDVLFNSIWDDPELNEFLLSTADRALKNKMMTYNARRKKAIITHESKQGLLTALGFERISKELWRFQINKKPKIKSNGKTIIK